jgi:hydrogenase maturation protease
MADASNRLVVIGYGNPGRLDDALGPAVAEVLAGMSLAGVSVLSDYQLNVEDAAAIAEHDAVVFVDAALSGPEPFTFQRITPAVGAEFSTHAVEPGELLALSRDLFGADRPGYVLAIRGYDFDEFGERLSRRALANMAAAIQFLVALLRRRDLRDPIWVAAAADEPQQARERDG